MTDEDSSAVRVRQAAAVGAYGLRIDGLPAAAAWMAPVGAASARLRVEVARSAEGADRPSELTSTRADIRLGGGGRMRMRRGEDRVRFAFAVEPAAQDLLHPYLAPAAALAQIWAGREAIHAGAFVARGAAVLLLAGSEGGKSTTLAWLARRHGVVVVADDLAVIADGSVLAGPRCIDLRASTVAAGLAAGAERVRAAGRLRLKLPGSPAAVGIGAVVSLSWGARVALRTIPPAERVRELVLQRMYAARVASDGRALLGLAALPGLSLARPRGERGLEQAASALLDYFG
jgi:hypothetical protein